MRQLVPRENSLENHGKVLASLECLGKTTVVPLLGPGHESQGLSSLNPQNSRIEKTNISAKGMTNTVGPEWVSIFTNQEQQASVQIQDNTTVLCPGTIGESPIRRLGGVVTQAP